MSSPQSIYPYGFTPAQESVFIQEIAGYYSVAPFDPETFRALAEDIKKRVPVYITLDSKSTKFKAHQADVDYDINDMSLAANFEMLENRVLANRAKAAAAKVSAETNAAQDVVFAPKKFVLPERSKTSQKLPPAEAVEPDVTRPNASYNRTSPNRTSPLLKFKAADALLAEIAPKEAAVVAELAPAAPSIYIPADLDLADAELLTHVGFNAAPQKPDAAPASASDSAKVDNDKKSTSVKKGWKATVKKIGKFALKVICFPAKASYNAFVSLKNRVKKTKPVEVAKGAADTASPAA